jgi:hypothetical protein
MRQIGSQYREDLFEAGYSLHKRVTEDEVILKDDFNGQLERWTRNDDYAGYVIEIDGEGYEFVRSHYKGEEIDE